MINKYFIVILSCVLVSCSNKNKEKEEEIVINNEALHVKSDINDGMLIFFKSSNNLKPFGCTELNDLVKDFVADSVNNVINIDFKSYISNIYDFNYEYNRDYITCFNLNDSISYIYKSKGFSYFFESVVDYKRSEFSYSLNSEPNIEKLQTIMYYLYLNNYFCYRDDYIGCIICDKVIDFKKKLMNIIPTDWYPIRKDI